MGKDSKISWCDHTQNYWWGCTEVSPACDFCYARILSHRWDKAKWGNGEPRMRTSVHNRNEPFRWNRVAEKEGVPKRVFCQSMSDFLDNEVPDEWRAEAWPIIRDTKWLRWMILSKRIGNADKMLPPDWGPEYSHVGFMATIANQQEADRDIPKLLALKGNRKVSWVGISVEPMLGPVDLTDHLREYERLMDAADYAGAMDWPGCGQAMYASGYKLDLAIVGGESGDKTKVRSTDIANIRALRDQCRDSSVAFFCKQLGRKPTLNGAPYPIKEASGLDMGEWPEDIRIQEMPMQLQK